jgi:hypothetical protein
LPGGSRGLGDVYKRQGLNLGFRPQGVDNPVDEFF